MTPRLVVLSQNELASPSLFDIGLQILNPGLYPSYIYWSEDPQKLETTVEYLLQ